MRYVRLSSPIGDLQDHYTVVVVGSGYGGGIAASRLARAGQAVCVLERGKERQPGEYPETEHEVVSELQVELPEGRLGPTNGLYDVRFFKDIGVLVGCGLGGTSLINANVSIKPDPRVFLDERWPAALRADLATRLADGYVRAEQMLMPAPVPDEVTLDKLRAQESSARRLGAPLLRTRLNVTFDDRSCNGNRAGVPQRKCNHCGDCVTGCNRGAKNTTLMNYLPDAWNHGAEIFTEVEVRRVSRSTAGGYAVHYRILGARRESFGAAEQTVTADVVILAAGTLGSTEILLRSRDAGLPASSQIGARFTGNGDVLGFGYNTEPLIHGIGRGHRVPEGAPDSEPADRVGPCITSAIDLRELGAARPGTGSVDHGILIEEGSLPGAIAAFLPLPLATAADLVGVSPDSDVADRLRKTARQVESLVGGAYRGATQHTQTYLAMSHEASSGTMELVDDRVRIEWPGIGAEPIFEQIDQRLLEATRALDGVFVRDPLWTKAFKRSLFTVHPLGGCAMGDTAEHGVVNHKGQVFSGSTGSEVYAGLYVADGSVIPRSLGCNPLFTISALAERTASLLADDRGWVIDYEMPVVPRARPTNHAVGVEFTERMIGYFSTRVLDDFARAEADGRATDSSFEFVLTIAAEDVERFTSDQSYEAAMAGSVRAPSLSAQPLTVSHGRFLLLADDPDVSGGKVMRYRMQLTSIEGRQFWFEGRKHIKDDPGIDLWSDTTTLYVAVSEGAAAGGKLVGRGILHIWPADFLQQLRATHAINADGPAERLRAVARFGSYFAGELWEVYGGVFARATAFTGAAPPRKKRALRTPAPEVHGFTAGDGTALRLTRYRGTRGPVVLAPGLGVSSAIFTLDTIETSLAEYLVQHSYDVWLLDARSSIALPAHERPFTADDLAHGDFPAAVAQVRALTGSASVQVVAHGLGAMGFAMAMLAGLGGVRSAVLSQAATHIATPALARLRLGLHIPEVLDALGITSLTAYTRQPRWKDRLLDTALKLFPGEIGAGCDSPACRRIALVYGSVYEHDQLDAATHGAIHELFGEAPASAFEHLARIARAGHVVAADGGDSYLPQLARLAIPIAFVHGAENACFLPAGTANSLAALSAANGRRLYQRHVIAGYGDLDCLIGSHAARDVYPHILAHLAATP